MKIQELLLQDMKQAMRAREAGKVELSVIRMVRAAIKNAEIAAKQPLGDNEILAILTKEMKLRKDSLSEFEKSNREDLIAQTKLEMKVLERYLPVQLSPEEVREVVKKCLQARSLDQCSVGELMKAVMPILKGKADGKLINDIVRSVLAEE